MDSNNKKKFKSNIKTSKPTMSHIRGIPPSPSWGNKFTSIIINDNLLYLNNQYLINIDLKKKEFYQLIKSSFIEPTDKFNVICQINHELVLSITSNSTFIFFQKYFNTNTEDKRTYFKDTKKYYTFDEYLAEVQIKTVVYIKENGIIFIGDNKENIHCLKVIVKNPDEIILKYSYSLNLTNCYITDMIFLEFKNLLFLATSTGELQLYSIFRDNIGKSLCVKVSEKLILSADYIKLNDDSILFSLIDKNGSLFIYRIDFTIENAIKETIVLSELKKFNDKSIKESYLFFVTKFIEVDETKYLLISSNKGVVYYCKNYDIISDKPFYNQISENPNTMAVYNIINYCDKVILFSADNILSFFNKKDLQFEFTFVTLGSMLKYLFFQNKNIYLFNGNSELISYNYMKKLNGLSCGIRRHLFKDKKSNKEISYLIKAAQAKFNEEIFAFVVQNPKDKRFTLEVYNYNSDIKLNYLSVPENVISVDFIKSSKEYAYDIKFEYTGASFSIDEQRIHAINELFSDKNKYDLLYILTSDGDIIIWDFIYNKTNNIKITSECSSNAQILSMLNEDFTILISNNKVSCFNQLISIELFNINEVNIICDYYVTPNNFYLFHVENSYSLRLTWFNKQFANLMKPNNYEEYIKLFNEEYKKTNLNLMAVKLENITNVPINIVSTFKNGPCLISIAQSDNLIKVYELIINEEQEIFSLYLRYSINAHVNKITNLIWIDVVTLVSSSMDHSVKLWNTSMCKHLNLPYTEIKLKENNKKEDTHKMKITLVNSINKLNSICLYQQSFKASDEFVNYFIMFYSELKNLGENKDKDIESIELNFYNKNFEKLSSFPDFLIFSLFKSDQVNFLIAKQIIQLEIKNITDSSNPTKLVPSLINLFAYSKLFKIDFDIDALEIIRKKVQPAQIINEDAALQFQNLPEINFTNTFFIALEQNDIGKSIELLLENNLFVEAIFILKLARMKNYPKLKTILEKLQKFICQKQVFQSIKVHKVIETLNNYFN
jgi:hypothetical protein